MLKRMLALVLAVCTVASAVAISAKAVEAGTMTVAGGTAAPGETVDVVIRVDSNPGVISARLQIEYDSSVLTLTKVTDGGIWGDHTFGGDLKANPYTVLWENGAATANYVTTGTLLTLTFLVAEDAPAGKLPVTVSHDGDIYNIDIENVPFTIGQGYVTIEGGEPSGGLLGDANSDGKVNNIDAMLILQYFAGIVDENKIDLTVCDVDDNGKINNVDAMMVLQYFARLITKFPAEK